MNPINGKKLKLGVFVFVLALTACTLPDRPRSTATPTGGLEAVTEIDLDLTRDWYVATTGDDTNSCDTPEAPCLTLRVAAGRALSFDRIHVAAGVYLGSDGMGEQLPRIYNKNLTITGEGSGVTIFDANNTYGGINIYGTSRSHLQGFTVQNTNRGAAAGCIQTSAAAELTAQDIILQNCWRSGLTHNSSGVVQLTDVIIADARDEDTNPDFTLNGSGIVNYGELFMEGGEVRGSEDSGLRSYGPITVTGTTFRDNQWWGVWVEYSGESNFTEVTITDNVLTGRGTGMFIASGVVNMSGSTVNANRTTAIFIRAGNILRMDTSTISDHTGRAIQIVSDSVVELDDVTITNNGLGPEWGPIIWNAGNLTMTDSRIISNFQQALYNIEEASAFIYDSEISGNRSEFATVINRDATSQMLISRSLIANNTVTTPFSAALENFGTLDLVNSTISNNNRIGIRMDSETTLSYVTIAENGEAGINQGGPGPFTIENSLIAKNSGVDCDAVFSLFSGSLSGNNIDTDGTCGFPETYSPSDIRLGPLGDNGGSTYTHELLHEPDSPAIDTATGSCPTGDQRRFSRAGLCDVGAYETSTIALSLESSEIAIGTPTPDQPGMVTIITTTPCYNGPGPKYGQHSALQAGVVTHLIGAGFTGDGNDDWVVTSHPTAANTNCWIPSKDIETNIPFDQMRLITVPGLPTPTPKPTSDRPDPEDTAIPCYYDKNNALICP